MKKTKKKTKKEVDILDDLEFLHLSPFDKRAHINKEIKRFLKHLPTEVKQWYLRFLMEEVNGYYDKTKYSIFNNPEAWKEFLKNLKNDPEEQEEFYKAKQKHEKKYSKKVTDYKFVRTYWRSRASKLKHRRRKDANATFSWQETEVIPNSVVNPNFREDLVIENYEQNKDEIMAEATEQFKPHQDIQDFLHYRKIDRIDKYIWIKIKEICEVELPYNKHFQLINEDIGGKNQDFEDGKFSRKKYMLYLHNCYVICDTFASQPESQTTARELGKIFDLVVYPRNNKNKIVNEKE